MVKKKEKNHIMFKEFIRQMSFLINKIYFF